MCESSCRFLSFFRSKGKNVEKYFVIIKRIEAFENFKKLPLSVTPRGSVFQGVGNVSALNWACLGSFFGKIWRVLQCINTLCIFFRVSTRCTSQGVTDRGNITSNKLISFKLKTNTLRQVEIGGASK